MAEVSIVGPLNEGDLAHEFRCEPAALLHLLGGESLAPARGFFLREINEGTSHSLPSF